MKKLRNALVILGIAIFTTIGLTAPSLAQSAIPMNFPSGSEQLIRPASNTSLGIGNNGATVITTLMNQDSVTAIFEGAGNTSWLMKTSLGSCIFYNASDPGHYHLATCNDNSLADTFTSLSSNSYSEQQNLYTGNCFYSNGNGGKLLDKGCNGQDQGDRWQWYTV